MTGSPYFPFIVLALVVGGIAAAVTALIRAVKRYDEQRKQARRDQGFAEAPEEAERLTERVKAVHMGWSSHHQVRDPWRKADWGYELFVFDLRSGSGKSTKLERDQAMVVSSDLSAPRFSLAPKAPGDGFVAQMANKAIAWVASKFAGQAIFPEDPSFDAKYFVFGDSEATLREYFDPRRRGRLAGIEFLQASGSGDAFVFSRTHTKQGKKPDPEKLQDLQQDARTLFEIFKS
jgi:gas vesicle protein